jgi:hypothetical protein
MSDTFKIMLLSLIACLCIFSESVAQFQTLENDSGWVQITTNLDEFYVVINEDFYNPVLLNNDEFLLLAAGKNQLRLVWYTVNDWRTEVTVIPSDTVKTSISFGSFNRNLTRSSYRNLQTQLNAEFHVPSTTLLQINDEPVPSNVRDTLLVPGLYTFEIKSGKKSKKRDVLISPGTVSTISYELEEIYPKQKSFYFTPGAGYWYHRKKAKSILTVSAMALLSIPIIQQVGTYSDAKSSFNTWESRYSNTQSSQEAIRFRENANAQRDIMIEARKKALWYGAGLALIYGFSVWDSMNIGTTRFYQTKITTRLATNHFEGSTYPLLVLTRNF